MRETHVSATTAAPMRLCPVLDRLACRQLLACHDAEASAAVCRRVLETDMCMCSGPAGWPHPFLLCNAAPPCSCFCAQQDHLDIRVIPSFQEVEKEDRNGEKHTMTAVKLQASMLAVEPDLHRVPGSLHMYVAAVVYLWS